MYEKNTNLEKISRKYNLNQKQVDKKSYDFINFKKGYQ